MLVGMEPGLSAGGSSSTSSTTGTFPACGMRVFPICLSSSDVSSPSPSQLLTGIITELLQLAENIPLFPRELEERRFPLPWGIQLCATPGKNLSSSQPRFPWRGWQRDAEGAFQRHRSVGRAGCGVCQQSKECSSSCLSSPPWGWSRADPGAPGAAGKGFCHRSCQGSRSCPRSSPLSRSRGSGPTGRAAV